MKSNNRSSRGGGNQRRRRGGGQAAKTSARQKKQKETPENHTFSDDEDDYDEDVNYCLICCERLVYVAIGPCNHDSVCANCTIRQRVLYKNRACALCKADMDQFVVTSDVQKLTWESWSDNIFGESCGGRLSTALKGKCDGFFDTLDQEYINSVETLLGFACGTCDHKKRLNPKDTIKTPNSVEQLKKHLLKEHKTHLCNVCVASGRRFVSELPRFTKSQLDRHNTRGEPTEGLSGHPPCNFCKPKRFYDDEALYYHMIDVRHLFFFYFFLICFEALIEALIYA